VKRRRRDKPLNFTDSDLAALDVTAAQVNLSDSIAKLQNDLITSAASLSNILTPSVEQLSSLLSTEQILTRRLTAELRHAGNAEIGLARRTLLGKYSPSEPAAARGYFFHAIFRVVPESARSLLALSADCPSGAWQSLPEWCSKRGIFLRAAFEELENCEFEPLKARPPQSLPLVDSIKRWGKLWHLTNSWCYEAVLTLLSAIYEPEFLNFSSFPPPPVAFLYQGAGWDPLSSGWYEFKANLRAGLDKAISAYRDAREAEARAQGFTKSMAKRSDEHYYWLAGYQCCGWSENRIAGATGKDRAAVSRAVEKTALQVGLTRRPAAKYDPKWTVTKIRERLRL
jgi:hypothetical protein